VPVGGNSKPDEEIEKKRWGDKECGMRIVESKKQNKELGR